MRQPRLPREGLDSFGCGGGFIGVTGLQAGQPGKSGDSSCNQAIATDPIGCSALIMSAATTTPPSSVKAQAKRIIRDLPDSASWDDLMYQIFVRQKIEQGLEDIREGRSHTHAAIKREFARGQ